MGLKLVIVESPAKARTIHRLLGGDFSVQASMGHVRDLPENRLGVHVSDGFRPDYVEVPGRSKVIRELRATAKKADTVYLAPDPDREGEAIAWHLQELLKDQVPEDQFLRVTYNEITADAIRRAFDSAHRIDGNKVNSQQARRVLDRLVGFKVSKVVRRHVKGGTSAGRVQSVALRLVCEREEEIENFKPREYWIIGARVSKTVDPRDPFDVRLARVDGEKAVVESTEQAERIRADLEGRALRVADVKRREQRKRPMPPFITSSLQQAGSRLCGFSPARTMRIAQSLYEGVDFGSGPVGLITYMRTDSVAIASSAQEAARATIGETWGPDYLPDRPPVYRSRGSAQEAHEAIRPTDPARSPKEVSGHLDADQLKLYRIIWQRFMASQMAPAVIAQRTAEVEAVPPVASEKEPVSYLFRATASEVVFPGYMKVMGLPEKGKARESEDKRSDRDDGDDVETLPPLEPGEALDLNRWLSEQKFTQPPPRFSEATLVRALEENGVGRPSTYAQTLATLQNRKYVAREKRQLVPTSAGRAVNAFLTDRLDALFNVRFTAEMEKDLDRIEQGDVDWVEMLSRFYEAFNRWLNEARAARVEPGQVERVLEAMKQVQTWAPETKRGKRVYSDKAFVDSLREQLTGGKALTEPQVNALRKLAWKYRDQVPAFVAEPRQFGLDTLSREDREALLPPRDDTKLKLDMLQSAEFAPARKIGRRTFDDAAFVDSLRRQVESGKRLSDRQMQSLDRIVKRYGPALDGYEKLRESLGWTGESDAEDSPDVPTAEIEQVLGEMERVTEWKPPVRKGKREWNDREFFVSLRDQYKARRSLSPRQVAALRKMAARYRPKPKPEPETE